MKQRILKFTVNNQRILTADTSVVADSRNYLLAHFSFDESWENAEKTAVFSKGDEVYNVLIIDDMCRIPAEVIKADAFYVSVFGGDLITADKVRIEVIPSGLLEGVSPPVPTEDIYNQLVERVSSESADAAASAELAVTASQISQQLAEEVKTAAAAVDSSFAQVLNSEQSAVDAMMVAGQSAESAGESASAAQGSAEAAYSCYIDADAAAIRAAEYAEKMAYKVLCSGTLLDMTEGVSAIKIEIVEPINDIKELNFLLEFPLSKTYTAGTVWITASIVDENEANYIIPIYSNQNQAITAISNNAVAVGFGKVISGGSRLQYMGVSQQITTWNGSNSRTTPSSVTAEYKEELFSKYPPYLKITVSTACPFENGTKWTLEGR